MTDLTEQWKKGELSLDKSYYLRLQDGSEEIQMYVGGFLCNENNPVDEVLAQVPSYEEYLALQSDSLAKNEGAEIVAELKAKVKQLKKDYKDLEYKFRSYKDFKETAYDLDTSRLEEENTKLKELLKECRERLIYCTISTLDVQAKIKQALGEDE